MQGGGRQPHIVEVKKMNFAMDDNFNQRGCVQTENSVCRTSLGCGHAGNEPKIIEVKNVNQLGHIEKGTGKHQSNIIYDSNGVAPCICAGMGVKQQPTMIIEQKIVAMRGRNPENPSNSTPGIDLEQRLEVNSEGICNTLTSVQKDNLVLEIKKSIDPRYHNFIYEIDGELYLIRIRKLIPRECWRLMGFTDENFDKAASVNSQTQLYKQAGNSIVKYVMMAIFRQML